MQNKIKLLFYTELWANAGIESVIMNLYRNFDLSRIYVDIMSSQNLSDFYDDEINNLGGKKIITLSENIISPAKRMWANKKVFKNIIRREKYDVVHLHMCNAAAMMYGKIAKKQGVKIVVYHSHNTNLSTNLRYIKTMVHCFSKILYEKYGDILFSCSDLASKWMYTKRSVQSGKVYLIKNAIDLQRFDYKKEGQFTARKKLGINDEFVVGHIGRFEVAKNHSFLIDIFKALHDIEPNSVLLLIGEGSDKEAIQEKVRQLKIENNVIFYGTTKEIPSMLWAMDAFVLPSLFEGNPVVGIEAQAAGTPCFFADTITKMCNLTNIVEYISLSASPHMWAKRILKIKGMPKKSMKIQMESAGYNVKSVDQDVQSIYEQALK